MLELLLQVLGETQQPFCGLDALLDLVDVFGVWDPSFVHYLVSECIEVDTATHDDLPSKIISEPSERRMKVSTFPPLRVEPSVQFVLAQHGRQMLGEASSHAETTIGTCGPPCHTPLLLLLSLTKGDKPTSSAVTAFTAAVRYSRVLK